MRALTHPWKAAAAVLLACMWASSSHADNDQNNCYQRTPAMVKKESGLHPDVRREADSLVIRTEAKTVTLKDKISPEGSNVEPECYLYRGFLPEIQLHVFQFQSGFEIVEFGVVHARTGEKAYLMEWPKVSPDAQRLASFSLNLGGNSTQESIGIWRVQHGKIKQEWAFAPPADWAPRNAEWIDSNTVRFLGECGEGAPEDRKEGKACPVLTARFSKDAWQIEWSPSPRHHLNKTH